MKGLKAESDCQVGAYGKYYPNTSGYITAASGTDCLAGFKCHHNKEPTDTLASATKITASTVAGGATACARNEICPAGTSVPTMCPPGKYQAEEGPMSTTTCVDCPTDYYCPYWGITNLVSVHSTSPLPYDAYTCPKGYVCNSGAIDPSLRDDVKVILCAQGKFCDMTIVPTYEAASLRERCCPANWFNNVEGQSECRPCPAGFFCAATGTTASASCTSTVTPEACPRGKYCIAPTQTWAATLALATPETLTIDCPAGTYNPELNA